MKNILILLPALFFFSLSLRAERVNAIAEIYDTEYNNQAIGYLERGAEVWIEEDKGGKRIRIYAKVWVKSREVKKGTAQANAVLYDRGGKTIGGLYMSQQAVYDTTAGFTPYALIIRGYIYKDRIDPSSIIEKDLAKLLDPKKGKITRDEMAPFFKKFNLKTGADTLGFSFFHYYEKEDIRLTLIFKEGRLIAVVPKKEAVFKYYIAEQKQAGIRIIYFEKLPPDEEQFIGSFVK